MSSGSSLQNLPSIGVFGGGAQPFQSGIGNPTGWPSSLTLTVFSDIVFSAMGVRELDRAFTKRLDAPRAAFFGTRRQIPHGFCLVHAVKPADKSAIKLSHSQGRPSYFFTLYSTR